MNMNRFFAAATHFAPSIPALAQARHIYPPVSAANADIAAALTKAKAEHKRVLLDFGGDWCGDCQVLDLYMHQPPNDALLNSNYVLVHVNIGRHMEENVEVAQKYGASLGHGVPALAVITGDGKVVYGQKNGEFEAMRRMDPKSVTEFLEQWKPKKQTH
jgi:thiol:disulfide interchange protein